LIFEITPRIVPFFEIKLATEKVQQITPESLNQLHTADDPLDKHFFLVIDIGNSQKKTRRIIC
jgi:hypothetical protein